MKRHKDLKIAVIMDEFTYSCYAPECEMLQVTPNGFKEEIDAFQPDLLFIESVWRGKDNLWRFKLHDNMEAITALTDYCKSKKIPIMFWSKEDPVHFGVFIRTAVLADYVFTTDAECIELYKAHLGHDRVYYLPFAAQPAVHHPIEEYERQDKFCFAGSFYVKYPERSQVFLDLADLFLEKGLEIYDRNFKKGESDTNTQTTSVASPQVENYIFPEKLRGSILGGLPYSEISKAYKGYKYGINMTSMVQSGFMFARRAFELMACNTVTVSNYSRGLEVFFGDLLISTNDKAEMKKRLDRYSDTDEHYRKFRLAGLRHVLENHLYEDRLDYIREKVLGEKVEPDLPHIVVLCKEETERILKCFASQTYENKSLVCMNGSYSTSDGKHLAAGGVSNLEELKSLEADFFTVFADGDYYAQNYLKDFALATRFAQDEVIGKAAYYGNSGLCCKEKAYTRVKERFCFRRQMISKKFLLECIDQYMGGAMDVRTLTEFSREMQILSLDEFNYCENAVACAEAEELTVHTGVRLQDILNYTEKIKPVSLHKNEAFSLEELTKEVQIDETDMVEKSFSDGKLCLTRDVDDDAIVWLRTSKNYLLSDYTSGSRIGFFTKVAEKSGNVRCQIEYYDDKEVKLGFLNFALDGFTLLRIQDRAKSFKLIFRMRGKSHLRLDEIFASSPDSVLPAPFPLKRNLLITTCYPSYTDEQEGQDLHDFAVQNDMEVIKLGDLPSYLPYSEYKGIQVISTQYEALREYLDAGDFASIVVGCSDESMMDEIHKIENEAKYKGKISIYLESKGRK